MTKMYLPIFFENLEKIPEKDGVRIATEILQDREKLSSIWGRIMYYNTNIENILKEHMNLKSENITLGRLIDKFETDCKNKRRLTKYYKLISLLRKLNKKCRVLWSHGCLTYSLRKGKWIKHLIYADKNNRGRWIERKVEIDNNYFDKEANILYPEVVDSLMKMVDERDSKGEPHLNRKTSFIIPMQDDLGNGTFIFVK